VLVLFLVQYSPFDESCAFKHPPVLLDQEGWLLNILEENTNITYRI
jgi:hypothetical protein